VRAALRILLTTGMALGAALAATPASAHPSRDVSAGGHAGFDATADDPSTLAVDFDRVDGIATMSVEWYDRTCVAGVGTELPTCDHVSRTAERVTPSAFRYSARGAMVRGNVTYQEIRYRCIGLGDDQVCSGQETGTGTGYVAARWSVNGESSTEQYEGTDGRRYESTRFPTSARAVAFGRTYGNERVNIAQIGTTRLATP